MSLVLAERFPTKRRRIPAFLVVEGVIIDHGFPFCGSYVDGRSCRSDLGAESGLGKLLGNVDGMNSFSGAPAEQNRGAA